MRVEKFFRLSWLQALLTFVNSGFVAILLFHFYKQHVTLSDIFLADAIACGANALFLLSRRSIHTRRDMRIGLGILALSIVFLILVPYSKPVFYLFYIFQVIGGVTFYIPLNILYFDNVAADGRMQNMAWYWIVGIISGIVGPLIGAFLFTRTSLPVFLTIPLVIFLIGIFLARYAPARTITYNVHDVLTRIKRIRVINILDGALHRVNGDTGMFALLFVASVAEYGGYLSFVSLIMVGVALLVARHSDKTNKRMHYLLPAALVAGVATIAFSLAHTFAIFIALTLTVRSALIIAEPLRSNIMMDVIEPHAHNWISREFYLNVGRAIIQLIAAALLFAGFSAGAFIVFGCLHLLFPILVHYKKIYSTV